jgi:peptide/nickel transport system permease protein
MTQVVSQKSTKQAKTEQENIYSSGQWSLVWRKFKKNRRALIAGIILAIMYLSILFAGFISPYSPGHQFIQNNYLPPHGMHLIGEDGFHLRPFVYGITKDIAPESGRLIYSNNTDLKFPIKLFVRGDEYKFLGMRCNLHLFGIDDPTGRTGIFLLGADSQGRDLFTRILYGGRISLTVGLAGVALSLILGISIGIISGYMGGWTDIIIQRFIEILRSFPRIPLWMALGACLPADISQLTTYLMITIILSLLGWTGIARNIRGQVMALRKEPYIVACRAMGGSRTRIIVTHLAPAVLGYVIVVATMAVPGMILGECSLSFLGLGIRPPMVSWGALLQPAQTLEALVFHKWLLTPALGIIIAVLCYNFLGDGLRDAMDPYSQTRR